MMCRTDVSIRILKNRFEKMHHRSIPHKAQKLITSIYKDYLHEAESSLVILDTINLYKNIRLKSVKDQIQVLRFTGN